MWIDEIIGVSQQRKHASLTEAETYLNLQRHFKTMYENVYYLFLPLTG